MKLGIETIAAVATACGLLVFALWYPYPYSEISGGRDLFLLVVSVEAGLGRIPARVVGHHPAAGHLAQQRVRPRPQGPLAAGGRARGLGRVAGARGALRRPFQPAFQLRPGRRWLGGPEPPAPRGAGRVR